MAQIGTPHPTPLTPPDPQLPGGPASLNPLSTGQGGRERSQPQSPARSQATPPETVHADAEDGIPVRYTNANIEMHREKLIEALRRPGESGPDYLTAEACLKALIAENKTWGPHAPEQLHIALGFGDVAPEEQQRTAALAKALRAAARQIESTLDPECRRMLDLATRAWQEHEKADMNVGTRLSAQRIDRSGPQPRQSFEWDANAIEADDMWNNPDQIRALEDQRDSLLFALMKGDARTITQILQAIPAHVVHLNRYFPPGQSTPVIVCTNIHKEAQRYVRTHPSSGRLQVYAFDCLMRAQATERVTSDLRGFTTEELDEMWPSEVRELCIELKHATTQDLVSHASQFQDLIEQAMREKALDHELAAQPYASLRTMQIQCTLLEKHIDADLLNRFRGQIRKARGLQQNGSWNLQQALLDKPPKDRPIALWAVREYAKRMTSLPFDYLSAGATWHDIETMKKRLEQVHTSVSKWPDMRAERVAVRSLIQQFEATLQH